MPQVLSKLLASDLVVLATPLYYFGMSAQLKTLIEQSYSANGRIQAKRLDAIFLATAWDREPRIMEGLMLHYEIICDYLDWNGRGRFSGPGFWECGNDQAYELP